MEKKGREKKTGMKERERKEEDGEVESGGRAQLTAQFDQSPQSCLSTQKIRNGNLKIWNRLSSQVAQGAG